MKTILIIGGTGTLGKVMAISEYFDRIHTSFDMRPTLVNYPIHPLRLRDFIEERVAEKA